MASKEYWTESLESLLDHWGIDIGDKLGEFADDIVGVAELESEACGHQFIPNPRDQEVEALKKQNEQLQQEVFDAQDNFRKNVAMRHKCSVSDITLGENGHAHIKG